MTALIVDDIDELRALHRMLFTRKFDGPNDEFFGSPIIAAVQRRLLDALTAREGSKWHDWANASDHAAAVAKVRAYLASAGGGWERASPLERRQRVMDLLSPLRGDEKLLTALVEGAP